MGEMTRSEAIYYHGRCAFNCAAFTVLLGLMMIYASFPAFSPATLMAGCYTGWHIGNVIWRSFHD